MRTVRLFTIIRFLCIKLFSPPIKEGVIVRLIAFNFNLQEETGINFVTGRNYIQLTAGMFQSSVECIEMP